MLRKLAVAAALLSLTGCATIMHGTTQGVGLSSNPSNARITVNNQPMGTTPTVLKLSRKDNHIVRMELDGYQPFEATLTRSTSGWVFGNIVFGGLIGLAVDAMSGGLYKLTPEQVTAQMASGAAGQSGDGLFLTVVMTPEAGWVKVGQLTRE